MVVHKPNFLSVEEQKQVLFTLDEILLPKPLRYEGFVKLASFIPDSNLLPAGIAQIIEKFSPSYTVGLVEVLEYDESEGSLPGHDTKMKSS